MLLVPYRVLEQQPLTWLSCSAGRLGARPEAGAGAKVYANGDVYEGLWAAGKCEGPGRYRWRNRNEYDGEWRAGRMHGQGTLQWNTGAPPAFGEPAPGHCAWSSAAVCCMAMLTPHY